MVQAKEKEDTHLILVGACFCVADCAGRGIGVRTCPGVAGSEHTTRQTQRNEKKAENLLFTF